jgi:hypothetical protein
MESLPPLDCACASCCAETTVVLRVRVGGVCVAGAASAPLSANLPGLVGRERLLARGCGSRGRLGLCMSRFVAPARPLDWMARHWLGDARANRGGARL